MTDGTGSTSNDFGLSNEQFQKLFAMIRNHVGQMAGTSQQSKVAVTSSAATSSSACLKPKFQNDNHVVGKYICTTTINSIFTQKDLWIVDTGATDHIVCDLGYFDNYNAVHNTSVNLPNGASIQVSYTGHIKLQNSIWLKDVLYVPCFNFNIVSVSKLLSTNSCSIIFLADQCLV